MFRINTRKIEERLIELGWSDNKLAQKSGVAQPVISRILNHNTKRPERETIRRICQALELEPGEVIPDTPVGAGK